MDAIEAIRHELKDRPNLKVEDSAGSIAVLPADDNGFLVKLVELKRVYVVYLDKWRHGFIKKQSGAADAVSLFKFGLSDFCRIKILRKGGIDYQWDLEYRDGEQWLKGSSLALMIYPFWKQDKIRYLCNNKEFSGDLSISFLETKNEQTRAHVLFLFLIGLASVAFYLSTKFSFHYLLAYWLLFFPFIAMAIFFPFLGISIWFDDRRHLIRRKTEHNKLSLFIIIGWCLIWAIVITVIWQVLGTDTMFGVAVILWPFLLCAFLLPVFVFYNRSTKRDKR